MERPSPSEWLGLMASHARRAGKLILVWCTCPDRPSG